MKRQLFLCLLPTVALILVSSSAQAQPHSRARSHNRGSGYRIDSRSHTVRNRHGYSYGTYHKDIIHNNSRYIVPHRNSRQHGTYYQENGNYYYHPQTYSVRPDQHLSTRRQPIAFGSFSRAEDLGSRLESLTNDFCLELHSNYSRNRGFDDVYREAYQMLEISKYIHKEKHDGHHDEIAREVSRLDEKFHHVQGEVSQWHSARDLHHNTSMGIQSHLELIEATIHHLMNDVGVKPRKQNDGHDHARDRNQPGSNIAPPPR
ncbi:MAG: hypothetical protein JKY95_12970 [Planctomycetaceae bacterium]|nr:hypothetical protein [Planctomycetaceae bacterium]